MIKFEQLAPQEDLLWKFKNKQIDEFVFEVKYRKQLESLDKKIWVDALTKLDEIYNNVVLCCYEKKDDFCHRHILADWLNINIKEIE